MSTTTPELLTPLLVSELPPLPTQRCAPSMAARVRRSVARRRSEHAFERAIRSAGHGEQGDLLAASRRA